MIPIVKGWSTESSVLVASLGVQVHGGMGYIEETGAAQHLRDARITPIYEGTTGIQAADLIGRKIARDGGRTIGELIAAMVEVHAQLVRVDDEGLAATALDRGIGALREAVAFVLSQYGPRVAAPLAGAVPLLELFGIVAGGWQMARAALAAQRRLAEPGSDRDFLQAKLLTARFYADHVLSAAPGLAHAVVHGADATLALADEQF
jgi:hypothetical protein